MPKKIELKTGKNKASVRDFIASVEDETKRKDAKTLLALFKEVTGKPAVMWGPSIIGFGEFIYHRSNGDEGTYCATGFSPRAQNLTVYIMPGYKDYGELLKKLGPHKLGKGCLYLKNLENIDMKVLRELVTRGLKDLKKTHKVL